MSFLFSELNIKQRTRITRQLNVSPSFRCSAEGFYPDSRDCKLFYRCVPGEKGIYAVQFECAPGTVFDPSSSTCNFPYASSRVECGGNGIGSGQEQYQTSNIPVQQTSTSAPHTTTQNFQTTELVPVSTATVSSTIGEQCTQEGFLGDSRNCSKFYRCVGNGQAGFYKYEFTCTAGTIWDHEAIACSYPWNVRRPECSNGATYPIPSAEPGCEGENGNEGAGGQDGQQTYPGQPGQSGKHGNGGTGWWR